MDHDAAAAVAAGEGAVLVCGLTPSGRVEVRPAGAEDAVGSGASFALGAAEREQLLQAFARGRGHGVLHLGAALVGRALHPSLAWFRELGQAVVSRVCSGADPLAPGVLAVPAPSEGELAALVLGAPPMPGAELLSPALLAELWADVGAALLEEAQAHEGGLQGYLRARSPVWNVVGRVCLHLAENKRDPLHPFAFLATYVDRVSATAKPQHLPLGRALKEYAGARNRQKLLALLAPLSRAAEASPFVKELVDGGAVYHPLAWTSREAYRFLREAAACEQAGLVLRLPDWWSRRSPPRPKVSLTVGGRAPAALGLEALLDFDVAVTLDGEALTRAELEALLAAGEGLALIKGRWVEVDAERLGAVLSSWREVERKVREEGIRFDEAMRLLAGAGLGQWAAARGAVSGEEGDDGDRPEWSEVVAGRWLAEQLAALRSPAALGDETPNAGLAAQLRPYQRHGVQWLMTLRGLGLGGCLADDMGLGKTIQVLGVLSLCQARGEQGTDLLVVSASLLENWRQEIDRFAPALRTLVAHPSRLPAAELHALPRARVEAVDAVITTYGTLARTEWLRAHPWRAVVLDEAQAIKNPSAQQTRAVKSVGARWRLALTGTPVENRLGDLWSIFDFLNPGLLGSARAFDRLCKAMTKSPEGYARLRRLVQPYILRRLKTDKRVIADLPDKTELTSHCLLSRRQAALYEQAVRELEAALARSSMAAEGDAGQGRMARRGLVLATLLRLKQICNHPSQWLGDGRYDPAESGKLARLAELCEPIAARQDKVLVFTQFRELCEPLAAFLGGLFGRPGLVLHGGTPVRRRQELVRRFQEDDRVPFFVLSLKAGGTGLNLTAASHVIHFDRWWNPAVENQATDRAFRIGQQKNVLVHKFVCRGTVEEQIDALMAAKQGLSDEVLAGGAEQSLTELSNAELLELVSLDLSRAMDS